jgi:hypothetical protein
MFYRRLFLFTQRGKAAKKTEKGIMALSLQPITLPELLFFSPLNPP